MWVTTDKKKNKVAAINVNLSKSSNYFSLLFLVNEGLLK